MSDFKKGGDKKTQPTLKQPASVSSKLLNHILFQTKVHV